MKSWLSSVLSLSIQKQKQIRSPLSLILLLVACTVIVLWQIQLDQVDSKALKTYSIRKTGGFTDNKSQFFYFYYYLDLFPVLSVDHPQPSSVEEADALLNTHPESLRTEIRHAMRYGDWGQIILLSVDALFKGSPANVTIVPFNRIFFIVSLLCLLISFWSQGFFFLGLILTLLLGSNPFQIYEVHLNNNVFGLAISLAIFLLALYFPLMAKKPSSSIYTMIVILITGLMVATAREIRSEAVLILVSCVFVIVTMSQTPWRKKLAFTGMLIGIFLGGSLLWESYFNAKISQARQVVEEVGGAPYPGPYFHHHTFANPFFLGLGDYDWKYGYVWADSYAYNYSKPLLEEQYCISIDWDESLRFTSNTFYDEKKLYYVKFEDLPEFHQILLERYISDATHDPAWYFTILGSRIIRIFSELTPIRLMGNESLMIQFPYTPVLLLLVLLGALWVRNWFYLKAWLFTLPIASVAFIITSMNGNTYYSIFHIILYASLLSFIVEILLKYGILFRDKLLKQKAQ